MATLARPQRTGRPAESLIPGPASPAGPERAVLRSDGLEPPPLKRDVPSRYAGLESPVRGDPAAADRGRALFARNCSPCHGSGGRGDGPSATGLDPRPANLREGPVLRDRSDAWIFYRLTEGKHGTAMPSFATVLSPADRWDVVAWLRVLGADAEARDPQAPNRAR